MLREPLGRAEAEKLARIILENGDVVFTNHGEQRADQRGLNALDVENVILRGRMLSDAEKDVHSRWSYKFETLRMVVVIGFRSETEMVIITTWRKS